MAKLHLILTMGALIFFISCFVVASESIAADSEYRKSGQLSNSFTEDPIEGAIDEGTEQPSLANQMIPRSLLQLGEGHALEKRELTLTRRIQEAQKRKQLELEQKSKLHHNHHHRHQQQQQQQQKQPQEQPLDTGSGTSKANNKYEQYSLRNIVSYNVPSVSVEVRELPTLMSSLHKLIRDIDFALINSGNPDSVSREVFDKEYDAYQRQSGSNFLD